MHIPILIFKPCWEYYNRMKTLKKKKDCHPYVCYKYWKLFILAKGQHHRFTKIYQVSKITLYSPKQHCLIIITKPQLHWSICFWNKTWVSVSGYVPLSIPMTPQRDLKTEVRLLSHLCSAWTAEFFTAALRRARSKTNFFPIQAVSTSTAHGWWRSQVVFSTTTHNKKLLAFTQQ